MFFILLFGLSEALLGIFVLSILANRPLFAAPWQHKSTQKHLSAKLEIILKQILNATIIFGVTNIHLSAYYCGIFIRRLFIFLTFCDFYQKLHIIFSPCFASTEIRRRLRKIKFYLLFRSACTNFVVESPNKRVARRVVWGEPNVRGACPRQAEIIPFEPAGVIAERKTELGV